MYSLTNKQIAYILDDIRARGVEMESLQQDLLDHVCCIIENNLEVGGDFEGFYATTIKTFFKRELREIEDETISLLTFKHYYTMKKIMIGSGTISVAAFILGSFAKFMHWNGASILLLVAILSVCFGFLPLMFVLKLREDNSNRDKLIAGIGTIFGILISLSTLFKIQHWAGANIMWLISLGILGLVFIPIYFFTGIRNPETKTNTIVSSILMVIVAGLLFTLSSVHPSQPSIEQKLAIYLQNEDLLKQMEQKRSLIAPENASIAEINKLCTQIKELIVKKEIGATSLPNDYQHKNIIFNDNILGGEFRENSNGQMLFKTLKSKIESYNATNANGKISLENTILTDDFSKLADFNNLYALNSLTQIQLLSHTLQHQ
jgi:hypothetical protein